MVKRYYGGLLTFSKIAANSTIASGIYNKNIQIQAVKANSWPASTFIDSYVSDPLFSYNSLLLSGDGVNNAQNNTFLDSSTNNFAITRNGNPSQGTFTPYGANWSNYFDGSSFIYPDNNILTAMGGGLAGNIISIEMWVYPTNFDAGGYGQGVFAAYAAVAANGRYLFSLPKTSASTTTLNFDYTTGTGSQNTLSSSAAAIIQNQWNHIAVTIDATTASSSTIKLFANGSLLNTFTGQNLSTQTTYYRAPVIGGANSQFVSDFFGYISNVRVLKGAFAYTGNYTVPTSPLSVTSNTVLLTCKSNGFNDKTTNNYVMTLSGSPQVKRFSPFSPKPLPPDYTYSYYTPLVYGGSGYFDGSGDYLAINYATGSTIAGDFTWETWAYDTGGNAYGTLLGWRNGSAGWTGIIVQRNNGANNLTVAINNGTTINQSSGTYFLNQWNHVALVRSGTTVTLYVNGTSAGTATVSGSFNPGTSYWIGSDPFNNVTAVQLKGYISNQRFTNGTALYTGAFTPSTAPITAVANTSLLCNFTNAGINDYTMNTVLETVGDVKVSTANSKFGGSSMFFDGTGDYLKAIYNPIYSLPNDFTVETWLYLTATGSGNQTIASFGYLNSTGTGPWGFYLNGTGPYTLYFNATSTVNHASTTTITIPLNTWNHVAYSRAGSTGRFFVNGNILGTAVSDTSTYIGTTESLFVGIMSDGTTAPLNGYLDDLRITKGNARYTANFTPTINAFALR